MNARDNIKPKSIRVAILQALADGAITTIDDLQIKMDEKREKIINNIYPAAADGLIKRMRDDVTKQAAYQITAKGRELLVKYASGKVEAPADVVEMREIPAPEVSRRKSEAVAVEVLETAMPGFTAAVVAQKDEEIARLNGAIKSAQGHIETLNGTIAQLGKEKDAFVAEIDRLWGKINGLNRRPAFDMAAHLQRQREWSARTFGPDQRVNGVVNHIRKELEEVIAAPNDLEEWIDVTILALDGAWRAGYSPEQIIEAMVAKQTKNEGRTWPDWRTAAPDSAIEHVEQDEQAKQSEPVGYVIQRPAKPLVRFTKAISAETRAMAFARTGQRAQVFALHLVGTAVPGSEWRKA